MLIKYKQLIFPSVADHDIWIVQFLIYAPPKIQLVATPTKALRTLGAGSWELGTWSQASKLPPGGNK